MSKRTIFILLIMGLGLLTLYGGVWYHDWPAHHFGTVEEGVLYRSGQPDVNRWPILRDTYGIKTVVDLREKLPDAPWAIAEREFCRQNGMKYVKIPIAAHTIEPHELDQFLGLFADARDRPVLVHCEHGSSRTGVMVAAYRVAVDGWSYEQALKESQEYKDTMTPAYAAYLRDLVARRQAGQLIFNTPDSPPAAE